MSSDNLPTALNVLYHALPVFCLDVLKIIDAYASTLVRTTIHNIPGKIFDQLRFDTTDHNLIGAHSHCLEKINLKDNTSSAVWRSEITNGKMYVGEHGRIWWYNFHHISLVGKEREFMIVPEKCCNIHNFFDVNLYEFEDELYMLTGCNLCVFDLNGRLQCQTQLPAPSRNKYYTGYGFTVSKRYIAFMAHDVAVYNYKRDDTNIKLTEKLTIANWMPRAVHITFDDFLFVATYNHLNRMTLQGEELDWIETEADDCQSICSLSNRQIFVSGCNHIMCFEY